MQKENRMEANMGIVKKEFGTARDGEALFLYEITNQAGMSATLTNLGATIVSVKVPDRSGKLTDVVLGYDTPEEYYQNSCYFGAVIGRSGNRIDKGRFQLNGKTYQLDINDNENNLHSGNNGFDERVWKVARTDDQSITFFLKDDDMEQGYPGNFQVSVTYTFTEDGTLTLHYEGEADADTVANLTNHVYFNLGGHDSGTILDHVMKMQSKCYTPVRDGQAIPTGEIAPVADTPMDFVNEKPIGKDIDADFAQLQYVGGYDHNYVIKQDKGALELFATVYSPKTGICLEACTDLPGFQFYAGNFMPEAQKGKGGVVYGRRCGFCLESQYYPNSINQEGFAAPILKAGEKLDTTTAYRFTVKNV